MWISTPNSRFDLLILIHTNICILNLCLVTLFNSILNFVVYLMLKPSLLKKSIDII